MKMPNLMIGDWLKANGRIVQVAAIHQKKIGYHEREDRLEWIRLDRITYIPLSHDFLLKNGFIEDPVEECYRLEDNGVQIIVSSRLNWISVKGEDWKETIEGKFLKVHQLQHILSDAGLKKNFVV